MGKTCSVDKCDEIVKAKELCGKHYARLARTGTTDVGERLVGAPLEERLWFRTEVRGECWESQRGLTRRVREGGNGYPGIRIGDDMVPVHLASYRLYKGEPPAGYQVHHRCENKRCWRPEHLVALTPAEHKALHHKTECVNGHALSDDNVRIKVTPEGWRIRICRACVREDARIRRTGKRDATPRVYKTHCINNHEFTPENTKVYTNARGHLNRVCITCRDERDRKAAAKRRERKAAEAAL